MWAKYGKTILAFLFTVYTVVQPLWFGDHHIDPSEGIIIALAIGNNLLVFIIPIFPGFKASKSIITAFLAALAVAQTAIVGGLDPEDWPTIIAAFLVALGVYVAPAVSQVGGQVARVGTGSDA